MMDFCIEILAPLVLMVAFILLVILFVYLILDYSSRVKEAINNKNHEEIEVEEDEGAVEEEYKVQKAIIVIGNENIEIEVDNYDIDDNIVEIKGRDGKVFITDIKNVLLISE